MSAFSAEGASHIDVEQFLKDAKITQKADIFKTREISIEELIELTREDLESFAKDLGFDALEKNRFIKAISKHQQNQHQSKPISTFSTSSIRKSAVIVSSAEHNGITKLYERYDKSSALSTTLQSSILKLNESESYVINQIESIFETLSINIQNKKKYLLNDIDDMMHRKKELLTKQLSIINNYLNIVQEGKTKYNEYINDSTLTIYKRRKMVLKMINDIMNYDGVSMAMLTSPKIQFDVTKYEKRLNKLCEDGMELNDCDEPRPLTLSIRKITFSTITVDFQLDIIDITSSKKILEISLEYAILPKSFVVKSADTKKKKKKNKKKKSESKSEDESDTTSTNQSESENESSSNTDDIDTDSDNDANVSNLDDINMDSLKWKQNAETIKLSKKHRKRNKYKVEDLKSNRVYVIRMRARNDSGWSEFSKIIMGATKKGFMDSWNAAKKGQHITIDRNMITSTNSSWSTVYGKTVCKKGYKYKWRMRITVPNGNNYHMMIGIVDSNRDVTSTHCQTNGCWIFNPHGSGSNVYIDGKSGKNYARAVRTGDIVEMYLDLKRFSLSFSINGTDYGSAMDNLPRDRKYHLAISTSNAGAKVELLKPK